MATPGPCDHLSRAYRHVVCDGITVVSGDDYVLLECPFRPLGGGTYCARCKRHVPLKKVVWADTGENIEKYRNRLYYSLPWKQRLYLAWFGNAYQGALNLRLDSRGRPLPPDEATPTAEPGKPTTRGARDSGARPRSARPLPLAVVLTLVLGVGLGAVGCVGVAAWWTYTAWKRALPVAGHGPAPAGLAPQPDPARRRPLRL